jgi:hypothetical protein
MLDPLSDCHFVRGNVIAGVAGMQQVAQSPLSLCLGALDCLGVAPTVNAVAEPPGICATRIDAAVAMAPFAGSAHLRFSNSGFAFGPFCT